MHTTSAHNPRAMCEGFDLAYGTINSRGPVAIAGSFPARMRVSFMLAAEGGGYFQERGDRPGAHCTSSRSICFKPMGMESLLCSDNAGVGSIRWLSVYVAQSAFETGPLAEIDPRRLTRPRINYANPRLWRLAHDLMRDIQEPGELSGLYREQLVSMMVLELVRDVQPERPEQARGLQPARLARVIELIEHESSGRLRLADLAAAAGLSVSRFSSAFRQSTGMAPYQWQLEARVRKAQTLMAQSQPLAAVARATGFSDQSHFTRVFRRITGATPSAWLNQRGCRR